MNGLIKIKFFSNRGNIFREPGSVQSKAIELYPGDAPVSAFQVTAYNSDWKTGVIGTATNHQTELIVSFESAGSLPRRILYTFDLKNDKDRRALKEIKAEGGPDLRRIKKQVLEKYDAYWATASAKIVSQPAEM